MRLVLTERFVRDVRALDAPGRAATFETLLALRTAMASPHTHAGLGIRKLHPSGIYEARVGLQLRIVFTLADDETVLVRVGDHDEVRRFLKSL